MSKLWLGLKLRLSIYAQFSRNRFRMTLYIKIVKMWVINLMNGFIELSNILYDNMLVSGLHLFVADQLLVLITTLSL